MKSICIFCGAKAGFDPLWLEVARESGRLIAERGYRLVFGGGKAGLMGAAADAALAAGGQVLGIIPKRLRDREQAHPAIQQMIVVQSMAERKTRMLEASDAFLTLPGGLGTLDELFEVLTLRQIGFHDKPSVILNANDYYRGLLEVLSDFRRAGLVDSLQLDRLLVAPTPRLAVDLIQTALQAPS